MHRTNLFLMNIRKTGRLYESMLKPICERYRLAQTEASVISFLYNNEGRDTAADIAELRMLPKSNVSVAVESLIQKSLLSRRQDTDDRRKIHLSLTPQADAVTKEIEDVGRQFKEQIFKGFTEAEINTFIRFNEQIAENIKEVK